MREIRSIRRHYFVLAFTAVLCTAADVFVPPPEPPCTPRPEPTAPEFGRLDLPAHRWYSKHLRAAGESPLRSTQARDQETFRFTWLPSFRATRVVRIEHHGNTYSFEAKELTGAGGYEPGTIARHVSGEIPPAKWKHLLDRMAAASFWSQTTADALFEYRRAVAEARCDRGMGFATDGVMLIVEGATHAGWHAIDRHNPSGPLLEAWRELEALAGFGT